MLEAIGLWAVALAVIGLLCWGSGYWWSEPRPTLSIGADIEGQDAEARRHRMGRSNVRFLRRHWEFIFIAMVMLFLTTHVAAACAAGRLP